MKKFKEERELTVILLVDASSSGRFGTFEKYKEELAAELCALLAFSAIKNNDKVGLIVFTDKIEKFIPPQKGKPSGKPSGKGKGKSGSRTGKGKKGGKGAPGGDPDGDDEDGGEDRADDPDDCANSLNFENDARWRFLDDVDMFTEIKKPCPTLRKVPPQHMRSVASKLGLISNAGAFAQSAVSRERALKYFFLFPRMIFQAPLRNRHNGRNAKSLYNARSILVGERLKTESEIRFRENIKRVLCLQTPVCVEVRAFSRIRILNSI